MADAYGNTDRNHRKGRRVVLELTPGEAQALLDLANAAYLQVDEGFLPMSPATKAAAVRAVRQLGIKVGLGR